MSGAADMMDNAITSASDYFYRNDMNVVSQDQEECLRDVERMDEALDMLDDWEARLGLPQWVFEEIKEALEAQRAEAANANNGRGA